MIDDLVDITTNFNLAEAFLLDLGSELVTSFGRVRVVEINTLPDGTFQVKGAMLSNPPSWIEYVD